MDFLFGMIELFLNAFVIQSEDAKPKTRRIVILSICAVFFAICAWMTWSVWTDNEPLAMRIITILIDLIVFPIGIWEIFHEHKNGWKYQPNQKKHR